MAHFFNFLSTSAPIIDLLSRGKVMDIFKVETTDQDKLWVIDKFWHLLTDMGLSHGFADFIAFLAAVFVLVALVWVVDKVFVQVSQYYIKRIVSNTDTQIDDIFLRRKFFSRALKMIPLAVVLYTSDKIFAGFSPVMVSVVDVVTESTMIILGLRVIFSLLDSWNEIYENKSLAQARRRPVKGYIQVVKIILSVIAGILVIAVIFHKDPTTLFVGLGTAAALLSLVFKDTILGFVASIQLSAQDMVRIGDWISMPSKNADGTVLDINVNSVKVQNWDNTVTMIPIYSMVSESFTNWRGMEQSTGRRFLRYFYFNIQSIKNVDQDFLERIALSKIAAGRFDQMCQLAGQSSPRETLTNMALFRAHIELFIRNNPGINDALPIFARYQQEITDKGVGIEIYAFTHGKTAVESEAVQRSLVEFVLASAPVFDMQLFQSPSGMDFQRIQNPQEPF